MGVLLIFGRLSWVAGRFTADTIEGIDSVWYTTEPIKDKDGGGGGWLYGCEGVFEFTMSMERKIGESDWLECNFCNNNH